MTDRMSNYTWFCMVCGERASGPGDDYDEWKVAHREVCPGDLLSGSRASAEDPSTSRVTPERRAISGHQTTPGRVTLTIRGTTWP